MFTPEGNTQEFDSGDLMHVLIYNPYSHPLPIHHGDFMGLAVLMHRKWVLSSQRPSMHPSPLEVADNFAPDYFEGPALNDESQKMPAINMVKSEASTSKAPQSAAHLSTIKMLKDMLLIDIDGQDRLTI